MQGCEGLVKLLEGVKDNRHCTVCESTKSKLTPYPTGKNSCLKWVTPLDKCYIDLLSGPVSRWLGKDFRWSEGYYTKAKHWWVWTRSSMRREWRTRHKLTAKGRWRRDAGGTNYGVGGAFRSAATITPPGQYLLGPFGCLAFLLLSEEQRKQRSLCGNFGRSLQIIYLGCVCILLQESFSISSPMARQYWGRRASIRW